MNPRRLLVALSAALLLSGAVTYFLSRKISRRTAGTPVLTTQKYVAASRPLQAGEVLKPESLTLLEWPAKAPFEAVFSRIEDVTGRALIYPVTARQPILEGYLAVAGSGIGLTVKIPEGMRATSVRSDEIVGVAGFLFPGSHVDVLVTLHGDAVPLPETQIVLQDVEVLTAGQKIEPEPGGKAETVGVVTLLLTPEDAQKVVLASNQGSIHFVLRNGADRGQVVPLPVSIAQLTGEARGRGMAANASALARIPKKPAYVVETILGDKRSTSEFEN